MNKAKKNAFGGMAVALIIVIMLPSTFQFFEYLMPLAAGLLMSLFVVEFGRNWSVAVYASSAILSLLILPNKEAAVLYAVFLGYYGIFKSFIESKMLRRPIEILIKLSVFLCSMVVFGVVMMKVFGMPYSELMGLDDIKNSFVAKYVLPITAALGIATCLLLDKLTTMAVTIYLRFWQKRVRKALKFK